MNILHTAQALRARHVSSRELTDAALRRIEQLNPKLNAFITVTTELALAQAAQADRDFEAGVDRGPLQGIPIALKDVFSTRGIRTTCGSKIFEHHVPDCDAAVTEKFAGAGAVLVGKTGMHELAYGITSNNPHFGTVRNPWDPNRIPGGSSGGSGSAVAAGMAFVGMGSDTGGSIRIPASYCGVVGLKPTSGRVSRHGVMPLDFSLDHMGPLTRTVRDAAVVMNAISGWDARDDTSSREPPEDYLPPSDVRIDGLRIGIPENFFFDRLDSEVETLVRRTVKAAESLGACGIPVRLPDIAAINVVGRVILLSEASATMAPYWDRRTDFGGDVLALLDQGRLISATDYINAQRLRRLFQQQFARVWRNVDCLFTASTPVTAPPIGADLIDVAGANEDTRIASTRLARSFNVLGLPALSVPCGLTSGRLPVGLQIVGPAFSEKRLLAVGAALEDAFGDFPTPKSAL